jgi:hypothetical protein
LAGAEAAAGTCAAPECQYELVRKHNQAAEQRRREDDERRAALAENVRPIAAAALGITNAGRYPLVVIPRAEPRLVPLAAERRVALTLHLTRIIAEAVGTESDAPPDAMPPEAPPELGAVLGQACGLCEGYCCGLGQNSAYLSVPTLRRYLAAHPNKSAGDLLAEYLSRLSDESVEGSCIYHQATGCGLSREMRSETCNRHFCQGLKEFRRVHGTERPVRGFFVTVRDGVVGQAAFIDETGTRRVPPDPAGTDLPVRPPADAV